MASPDFLLDTSIVLHYARRSPLFECIESKHHLLEAHFRPMVCVVTLGEIKAIAYRRGWGGKKLAELDCFLSKLLVVDINDARVIEAYAKISAHATKHGWALHSQKNDLWIAATAHVTGNILLTTDKDFSEADGAFVTRILYHATTGAVLP